jgi:hypothetical protein
MPAGHGIFAPMPAERRIAHHHVMHNSGVALEFRIKAFLCTSFALRTLRTDRSLRARRAGFATLTGGALRTNGTLRPLCALRSARTNGTCWAGWTRRARWALRPRRRLAASADYQDRKKGGNAQGKSHG